MIFCVWEGKEQLLSQDFGTDFAWTLIDNWCLRKDDESAHHMSKRRKVVSHKLVHAPKNAKPLA